MAKKKSRNARRGRSRKGSGVSAQVWRRFLPQSTAEWIILVFFLLCALFLFYQPQLEQLVDRVSHSPLAPDLSHRQPAQAPLPDQELSLTVHFLDVGQGDATLLISGDERMLIDGGDRAAGESLVSDLDRLGITHLDYLVASHSHEDHIGGLPRVLEAVSVERCILSDDVAETNIYTRLLEGLEAGGVAVTIPQAGESFSFGDCTVTILGPLRVSEEHNENSLVMMVSCGEADYLFTGDMEGQEEEDMLIYCNDLRAEVLKVSHHGSEYTCGEDFLDFVDPEVAIISCGADNSYGHPNQPLLDRLADREIGVYRTDLRGDITLTTTVTEEGTETRVRCERQEEARP
ncbi:MAG: MBL fold metallo-hydrolase [Oscillospiraceae bacterium]|nr:MBL fold metallo-hydrolase [Oscillospiraceae bacterium]